MSGYGQTRTEINMEAPGIAAAPLFHVPLKAMIKCAIVVLDALGDSEQRFQNVGQVWAGRSTT
jgi:hypothetical protein